MTSFQIQIAGRPYSLAIVPMGVLGRAYDIDADEGIIRVSAGVPVAIIAEAVEAVAVASTHR
jgi:hypothetical protein